MKHLRRPSRHRRWLLPAVGMLVVLPLVAVGMIRAGSAHTANAPTVVSIEFDDGYSDQYQALSMLSAHNMHATFFVNSGLSRAGELHDLVAAPRRGVCRERNRRSHRVARESGPGVDGRGDPAGVQRPRQPDQPGVHCHRLRLPVRREQRERAVGRAGCGYNSARE